MRIEPTLSSDNYAYRADPTPLADPGLATSLPPSTQSSTTTLENASFSRLIGNVDIRYLSPPADGRRQP